MAHSPYRPSKPFLTITGGAVVLTVLFFALPYVAVLTTHPPATLPPFPVSVDPKNKVIVAERPELLSLAPLLVASAINSFDDATQFAAAAIMSTKLYGDLKPDTAPSSVTITPGMRQEQVANVLTSAVGWSKAQRQLFLDVASTSDSEGHLYPSTYILPASTTPAEAYALISDRFSERVLARYGTTTSDIVPVKDALTIASIIEREAGTTREMRIIAGILWNRLFLGMKLQADSTLSYARGTAKNGWWPVPRPRDKYIASPYNTYQNLGLPPGPIANPSIPAIMAALNPEKTDCVFFFHDSHGAFTCSATYEDHVKKLKAIYGRGK
jgi:UPF0755 protein